ncbi:MAG: hypothetical protein H7Z40_10590 [Phycisphaerae bacterium]|nr:hypothetical protein [Gemmatimonadaceae bacterium]
MRLIRWNPSAVLASAALMTAPFSSATAIERNLLVWTSRVDREVIIQIRGRDVATRGSGMDASFAPRVNISQSLPREAGIVRAFLQNGRGDVDVIEHPSARNNYTATIRVRDVRAGADEYRVVVMYETNEVRDYPGNGRGNGRGNGNDRGDDWDRDGRDRDRDNRDRDNRDRDGRGDYDRHRRDAGALRWSGMVDGVAEIRIQGARIDGLAPRGDALRSVRYDIVGASMPRRDVRLEIGRAEGRGTVQIVQQPSVWNQYVAVVRIEDARPGYGAYAFDIRW